MSAYARDILKNARVPYKDKIRTITADNGKEFVRHKEIAEIECILSNRPPSHSAI